MGIEPGINDRVIQHAYAPGSSAAATRVREAPDRPVPEPAPSMNRARTFLADEPQFHPFVERLTPRECDVLRHLPTMTTRRDLAQPLVISHNTLKTHLKVIYRKLGVVTRSDAVDRARLLNLLQLGTAPSASPSGVGRPAR
jgi:ATP/maltotriose-dependent transcriptional regulator MalT